MNESAQSNVTDNREQWVKKRRDWIGSSDIATVVGLNKWQSPLELWALKTGKVPEKDPNSPYFIWGRMVEPAIRELFRHKHREYKLEGNDTTYYHETERWAVATPDNWLTFDPSDSDLSSLQDLDHSGGDGILEMKTSSRFDGWEDGVPDYAHVQTMWQLGICKRAWARVAGVLAGRPDELRTPFFRFDQSIFDLLMEKGAEFMKCVREDIPPNAGAGDSRLLTELIAKHESPEAVELPSEIVGLWVAQYDEAEKMRKDLSKEVKHWDEKFEEAKNNIRKALGNSALGLLEDGRKVTLKKVEKQPYTVTPKPYFTFSIK